MFFSISANRSPKSLKYIFQACVKFPVFRDIIFYWDYNKAIVHLKNPFVFIQLRVITIDNRRIVWCRIGDIFWDDYCTLKISYGCRPTPDCLYFCFRSVWCCSSPNLQHASWDLRHWPLPLMLKLKGLFIFLTKVIQSPFFQEFASTM